MILALDESDLRNSNWHKIRLVATAGHRSGELAPDEESLNFQTREAWQFEYSCNCWRPMG